MPVLRRRPNGAASPHRRTARVAAVGALAIAVSASTVVLTQVSASADPSPNTWHRLRMCESGNNYSINTGNDHYGAYQFDLPTWHSVGGHGYPYQASKAEQDARALILYRERGWQPWQCASILGLHEDADAGTGRIGDISVHSGGSTTQHHSGSSHPTAPRPGAARGTAPVTPAYLDGTHYYSYGDRNGNIEAFQNAMHARGYFPPGTGQYGPKTLAMVKRLQQLNGVTPSGKLGVLTWRLAWQGRYAPVGTQAAAVPSFPGGSHWYRYGERNNQIKAFQNQMHARGLFPAGTGQYGPKTLAMVKRLQQRNGLVANGYIGPNTWALAWTGKY